MTSIDRPVIQIDTSDREQLSRIVARFEESEGGSLVRLRAALIAEGAQG